MTPPIVYGELVQLSPLVRRVTQNNPGLFAGPGTNTHLVGTTEVVILDPGEDRADGHFERLLAAVGPARVIAVIPSHGHPDHWPLAPRLAKAFGAPIRFFGDHPGFVTDQPLGDGERILVGGGPLTAIHTPGHTPDHLCFVLTDERALFPGDMAMEWSTSIIAPPEGDLAQYLRSLERLLTIPDLVIGYPAHGPALAAPYDRIRQLIAHRRARTRQLLTALSEGPRQLGALVTTIYADTDPALHPAAAQSLLAHLLAVESEGVVERVPGSASSQLEAVVWRLR